MNPPPSQCPQCGGVLVPDVHVAIKGHKLAMLSTLVHDPEIQRAIPNMQTGAGAMLKWH